MGGVDSPANGSGSEEHGSAVAINHGHSLIWSIDSYSDNGLIDGASLVTIVLSLVDDVVIGFCDALVYRCGCSVLSNVDSLAIFLSTMSMVKELEPYI